MYLLYSWKKILYPLSDSCWKVRTAWKRTLLSLKLRVSWRINCGNVICQTIISHATSVSDMLELAIMLKEVGFGDAQKARVQIVLWNNRRLDHSEETMRRYFYLWLKMYCFKRQLPRNHAWLPDSNKGRWLHPHVGPSIKRNNNWLLLEMNLMLFISSTVVVVL